MESSAIEKLITDISKLPGLGRRSAQRIALYLLKNKDYSLLPLIQTLKHSHEKIIECKICGNVDMVDPCNICSNSKRDLNSICIVEDVSDLWTFERIGFYKGLYHVLGGTLSAIDGVSPKDIGISELVERAQKDETKEIILAMNATIDGQTTAYYITDQLAKSEVKVSRLARGVPVGGELDYMDDGTLLEAIESRQPF